MGKYLVGVGLIFSLFFGSVSAKENEELPSCPAMSEIKTCKILGIFNRSKEFRSFQTTAIKMCQDSEKSLKAFAAVGGLTKSAQKEAILQDLGSQFAYGVTIFNNTVDGCRKKEFEQSSQIFKKIFSEIEDVVLMSTSESHSDAEKEEFLEKLGDEDLKKRIMSQLKNSAFASIPSSENIFASGKGKILGYDSALKDYTGEGKTGNSQLRSILNNLFSGVKKLLIPVSIFLIVFAGVQLFLIGRSDVSDEIPKKRNQVINILIGWTVFSLAFTVVDFVVFGNGKDDFIFRDSFDGDGYTIDEEKSMEFARRIFGEAEGIVDFMLTLFVIVSVFFLIVSCIRLVFGDDENYEATKKQVMQSVIASVVAISLKPLLVLFYRNGEVVRPDATSVIEFFAKWSDYVLGFIGLFATISLIYGGIRLVIDYGNGEAMDEAKKIIQYSLIGVILAFSAWSLANLFATPGEVINAFVLNLV